MISGFASHVVYADLVLFVARITATACLLKRSVNLTPFYGDDDPG